MWKKGRTHGRTSWKESVVGSTTAHNPVGTLSISLLDTMLVWVSWTPFGKPVVPDEYGRNTTSSGCRLWCCRVLKWTPVKMEVLKISLVSGWFLIIHLSIVIYLWDWIVQRNRSLQLEYFHPGLRGRKRLGFVSSPAGWLAAEQQSLRLFRIRFWYRCLLVVCWSRLWMNKIRLVVQFVICTKQVYKTHTDSIYAL